MSRNPDPSTLALWDKKARETTKKARVFLFAEALESLERKEKQKKQGTSENKKKNRIQGSGNVRKMSKTCPKSLAKTTLEHDIIFRTVVAYLVAAFAWQLSGMFRRSASLAIPHHKNFAAIPSLSLVALLLGHTNRSVSVSHESQR